MTKDFSHSLIYNECVKSENLLNNLSAIYFFKRPSNFVSNKNADLSKQKSNFSFCYLFKKQTAKFNSTDT